MSLYGTYDHYDTPIGPDGTPFQYFEALRDEMIETETPIGWSDVYGGFWVVTGWEESRDIMHDTENFSNREVTFPSYGVGDDSEKNYQLMLAGQDEPDHKKYRRLVQGPFSPKRAADISAPLRETTNELIDGFIDSGRCDIVETLTNEVPARLTAIILGLPPEDGALYRSWTHAMAQQIHTEPEAATAKLEEMGEYFEEMLESRRRNPGDDVLSLVIESEIDGQKLTHDEIKDFWVVLLLGGIDNTTKLLGSMLWRMAWDKELRRRHVERLDLLKTSIDEFLRYYSPALTCRLVAKPVEIHGVEMEPGQHVVLENRATNRDPRQFDHPDVFDPERTPNRHFGLGLGIHRCLGAHLVRVEAEVASQEFIRRVPVWELDPDSNPHWVAGQVGGMETVPIVFPPGGGTPDPDWTASRSSAQAQEPRGE
jgi:cytochrome P450